MQRVTRLLGGGGGQPDSQPPSEHATGRESSGAWSRRSSASSPGHCVLWQPRATGRRRTWKSRGDRRVFEGVVPPAADHQRRRMRSPLYNNLFFGLPAPSTAKASVTADPEFVAPWLSAPFGFILRPGSPAIGAGAPIGSAFPPPPVRDYFGAASRIRRRSALLRADAPGY